MPLAEAFYRGKVGLLLEHFASQRDRRWFTEHTCLALMRLRSMEANAPSRYAEGFWCPKLVLG